MVSRGGSGWFRWERETALGFMARGQWAMIRQETRSEVCEDRVGCELAVGGRARRRQRRGAAAGFVGRERLVSRGGSGWFHGEGAVGFVGRRDRHTLRQAGVY